MIAGCPLNTIGRRDFVSFGKNSEVITGVFDKCDRIVVFAKIDCKKFNIFALLKPYALQMWH